jgi:hypothetical protein
VRFAFRLLVFFEICTLMLFKSNLLEYGIEHKQSEQVQKLVAERLNLTNALQEYKKNQSQVFVLALA